MAMQALKPILCLLLFATTLCTSARLLDETAIPAPADAPDPTASDNPNLAPIPPPAATLPATAPTEPAGPTDQVLPSAPEAPAEPVSPVAPETTTGPPSAVASTTTATAAASDHHAFSFFMHDILGGSHPSGRVVTGIVTNTDASSNLPFSKANNQVFPINGGVPLNTINGAINDNNYPLLVGLNGGGGGGGATLVQSNGNSVAAGSNSQAFVTAGQLPQGLTLQQLMFGSITVVDNEITEGHELGTAVLGRAQGFYIVSSTDGTSHTLSLTALLHGGGSHGEEVDDTISFFGIHRTATPVSHIAVVGGTGKYENAKGYATVETLPHEDQHTTDGVETITQVTVYLTP